GGYLGELLLPAAPDTHFVRAVIREVDVFQTGEQCGIDGSRINEERVYAAGIHRDELVSVVAKELLPSLQGDGVIKSSWMRLHIVEVLTIRNCDRHLGPERRIILDTHNLWMESRLEQPLRNVEIVPIDIKREEIGLGLNALAHERARCLGCNEQIEITSPPVHRLEMPCGIRGLEVIALDHNAVVLLHKCQKRRVVLEAVRR